MKRDEDAVAAMGRVAGTTAVATWLAALAMAGKADSTITRHAAATALKMADVAQVREGLKLTIRHSKTDQEGAGQVIAVPAGKALKPVALLKAWPDLRGGEAGPCSCRSTRRGG